MSLTASLLIFWFTNTGLDELQGSRETYTALASPGRNVSGLSYDGSSLWVTIDGAETIYQVEPESWQVKRQIAFPVKATGGSAWDGKSLWQLAYEEKRIYQLDLPSGRVLNTIPSPGDGMCSGTTFDGKYLWVANFEDKKLYQIDQNNGGKIVQTLPGYFEATGLAWDGQHLWNGILVGTLTHDEETPYTGFVQQKNLNTQETSRVLSIPGVGPGTSDWTPASRRASRFWWYDGFHNQIVRVELREGIEGVAAGLRYVVAAPLLLNIFLIGLLVRRGLLPAAGSDASRSHPFGLKPQQLKSRTQ